MPERDAVREALVTLIGSAEYSVARTAELLGVSIQPAGTLAERIADALLSRALPERRTETYPHDCGCETCPEHTRAQPEVEVRRSYNGPAPAIEMCDHGHRFGFLPDHPRVRDGHKLCPHCATRPAPVVTEAMDWIRGQSAVVLCADKVNGGVTIRWHPVGAGVAEPEVEVRGDGWKQAHGDSTLAALAAARGEA